MAVILFSEPVYRHWQSGNKPDYSKDQQYLDSLVATLSFIKADSVIEKENPEPAGIKFYPFDPNTLAEDKLAQLGLPAFLVKRIARYREKGGSFRKKEDVAKIYGMDSAWYRKAEPWITIAPISAKEITARAYEKKIVDIEVIDINIADSTQLMKVYGIGPALSKRIRTFRDRLGGFVSMEQLSEVYGIDTTAVKGLKKKFFIAESFVPQKIDLNKLNPEEMKHPYIRHKEAYAIIAYRKQHGDLESIDQLKEIKILSTEWIERIRPYVAVEQKN